VDTWDTPANITRSATANGATQAKTFTASGLSELTQYGYRIYCGKRVEGVFKTGGTP
jgi:hypothetical protein